MFSRRKSPACTLQNDRLANYHMALKAQHEHKMAEQRAAALAAKMADVANAYVAMRDRVEAVDARRANTAVVCPPRMARNPHGHAIHMARE